MTTSIAIATSSAMPSSRFDADSCQRPEASAAGVTRKWTWISGAYRVAAVAVPARANSVPAGPRSAASADSIRSETPTLRTRSRSASKRFGAVSSGHHGPSVNRSGGLPDQRRRRTAPSAARRGVASGPPFARNTQLDPAPLGGLARVSSDRRRRSVGRPRSASVGQGPLHPRRRRIREVFERQRGDMIDDRHVGTNAAVVARQLRRTARPFAAKIVGSRDDLDDPAAGGIDLRPILRRCGAARAAAAPRR